MADQRNRPIAPAVHTDPAEHRRQLAMRANSCLPKDGTESMQAPLKLRIFNVSDLPDPALWEGALAYATGTSGGDQVVYSDGSDWRLIRNGNIA